MPGLHLRRSVLYPLTCIVGLLVLYTTYLRQPIETRCNPYSQPGYLTNSTNPHLHKWTPFLSTCRAPSLVPSVLRENWAITPAPGGSDVRNPEGWWREDIAPDGEEWEDVEWAKGRTVLVVGDSVSRFNVKYLCEMAGEPLRELSWDHPWSPPKPSTPPAKPVSERVPETPEEYASFLSTDSHQAGAGSGSGSGSGAGSGGHHGHRNPLKHVHRKRDTTPGAQGEEETTMGTNSTGSSINDQSNHTSAVDSTGQSPTVAKRAAPHIGDKDGYMGHYCHLPGVDLMVIQVFNFGLDEKNFWTVRDDYVPPYTIEDRISHLALPYVQAAGRPTTAPELMYLGSALWDTTRWMKEDAVAGREISEGLSGERLVWYRTRVRQVLVHAKKVFPNTSLKWLSHHYPLRAMSGWFFEGSSSKTQKPSRPQQKLNRLYPLQQAARSAVQDLDDATREEREILKDVGTARWGELMMGQEDHQQDDLHQLLLPGGYLWAEMMLYDLREAVSHK